MRRRSFPTIELQNINSLYYLWVVLELATNAHLSNVCDGYNYLLIVVCSILLSTYKLFLLLNHYKAFHRK